MKELRQTGQFKRDLKRYQHSKDKLAKLVDVLELLRQEMPIPWATCIEASTSRNAFDVTIRPKSAISRVISFWYGSMRKQTPSAC